MDTTCVVLGIILIRFTVKKIIIISDVLVINQASLYTKTKGAETKKSLNLQLLYFSIILPVGKKEH